MPPNNIVHELECQLTDMLDEESFGDLRAKLRWLCIRLDEFLFRWIGYARMENVRLQATFNNKVYSVTTAAINVLGDYLEIARSETGKPLQEWQEFLNAMEWIRRCPETEELYLVERTFRKFARQMGVAGKL